MDKEILKMRFGVLRKLFEEYLIIANAITGEDFLVTTVGVKNVEGVFRIIDFMSKQEDYPTSRELAEHTLEIYRKFASQKSCHC